MAPGSVLVLLGFLAAGELVHRVLGVPLSGPLLGMVLLFLALIAGGGPSEKLQDTTRPLLASLALLFVPAGVGVSNHLPLIEEFWLPILIATVGGAAVSLLACAATMILVQRLLTRLPLSKEEIVEKVIPAPVERQKEV